MPDMLMRPADIAKALGVPLQTFYSNVVRLRREEGFPDPLPGMGGRYDPLAIDQWRRARASRIAAPTPAAPTDQDLAAWQAKLDARSEQIGRQGGTA